MTSSMLSLVHFWLIFGWCNKNAYHSQGKTKDGTTEEVAILQQALRDRDDALAK